MEKAEKKIDRIAIVGPECTGKSTLSEQLAAYYKTRYMPEFAREYIAKLQRPYTLDDIVEISKGQMQAEDEIASLANKILICDTNLVVTKIWAEFKYNVCPEWIKENIKKRKYTLHLLTYTDIPWQDDPQREHPYLREELFELYHDELTSQKVPFVIISGSAEIRLQKSVEAISSALKN
ncbi:MAG TPA: ATP-binding protein [Bacteroidia bacterium]|jgi:NadR type nicotinamide-nucleotide adenylyltransferase|nr:ATP-binding protein [Bacteroidia bacterium]